MYQDLTACLLLACGVIIVTILILQQIRMLQPYISILYTTLKMVIIYFLDVDTEYWEENESEVEEDLEVSIPSQEPEMNGEEEHQLVWWIMLFLSLFQTLHAIPEKAISWLLCFLAALLKYLGRYSSFIERTAAVFPSSMYRMNKYMNRQNWIKFHKYVVCSRCHSLYHFSESCEKRGSQFTIKVCDQRQKSGRMCGMPLLKRIVKTCKNQPHIYPYLIYAYNDVIPTLKMLFSQKAFYDECESTRTRESDNYLRDVFDGQVWRELKDEDGTYFFSHKNHYGLFLNVDWYQPHKNRKYSVGVIYMVVLNLPREIRYKRENVILVGLIPGPKEPPLSINSYITPLVSELLELWEGVQVEVRPGHSVNLRFAVAGVGCDLPAGRKLCGFLSYTANLGCSRC